MSGLLKNRLNNLRYKFLKWKFKYLNPYRIMSSQETIRKVIDERCSVCRYGDGELLMLLQDYSIGFQKFNDELRRRLSEILVSNRKNVIVCLPYMLKSMDNLNGQAYWYWEDFLQKNRQKIYNLTQKGKLYGDTQFTRPYIVKVDKSECLELFEMNKKIWEKKDVLIVEGKNTCLGVGNDLLANTKSIRRIIAPSKNAFEKYDLILEQTIKHAEGKLILIALGPAATVLAYDLAERGFWAIDIGHIDIEYEWFLRNAEKKIAIEGKYVNEVLEGRNPIECKDRKYMSEIIMEIV